MGLIETIVVFEYFWHFAIVIDVIGLIETIVVFELKYSNTPNGVILGLIETIVVFELFGRAVDITSEFD